MKIQEQEVGGALRGDLWSRGDTGGKGERRRRMYSGEVGRLWEGGGAHGPWGWERGKMSAKRGGTGGEEGYL